MRTVVRDDGVRDAEPGDDVFPDELFDLGGCDVDEGLGFNPFGEVVRGGDEMLESAGCGWEYSDDIEPPLCKGSGTCHWL